MHDELDAEVIDLNETPDDKQLSHDIDELLAKYRPERYDASDKDWMNPVISMAAASITRRPHEEVAEDDATRRVYRREAEATKKTNRILRDIADTGEMPLGWGEGDAWRDLFFDVLHLPLSIARQRVRFGVASASDLEQWELENGREDDKQREARIRARSGARLLAQWLKDRSAERVEDLPPNGEAAA